MRESESGGWVLRWVEGPRKGKVEQLTRLPASVGRAPGNDVEIAEDPTVSRRHCLIDERDGEILVSDLGSTHGTSVNGIRIGSTTAIRIAGDIVGIGKGSFAIEGRNAGPALAETYLGTDVRSMIDKKSNFNLSSNFAPGEPEAITVIDVCKSTEYIHEQGDGAFLLLMSLMYKILTHKIDPGELLFIKCTGDGFMLTTRTAEHALAVSTYLIEKLKRAAEAPQGLEYPGIRIGLHYGNLYQDPSGDRVGREAHLAFRLQAAAPQECVDSSGSGLVEKDRILATEAFLSRLGDPASRSLFTYCGGYVFKGFGAPNGVYQMVPKTR